MMAVEEIREWLDTLQPGTMVGINEDGLALATVDGKVYIEVGMFPLEGE